MGIFKNLFAPKPAPKSEDEIYAEQYKNEDLIYEKAPRDYKFDVKREPDRTVRYFFDNDNNIWKQKEPGSSGTALIACGGDLMCEPVMSESVYAGGEYFFNPMFKKIAPFLKQADFAIANLETIVSERFPYAHQMHVLNHLSGMRYHCNAPLQYLDALRFAGFDGFGLANNHNADCGYEGIVDTINNLDNASFMHTGMFRNDKESRVLHVEINGIHIAVLSYTEHVNHNMDEVILTPLGREVMLNFLSEERIRADVKQAREEGAEFIICYIHLHGIEYSHRVLPECIETGQMIADAGVDCVIGTHMHAVQRYERLTAKDGRSVPIIYSLGNVITSEKKRISKQSVIYLLTLQKDNGKVSIKEERYIPCYTLESFQRNDFCVYPVHAVEVTGPTSQKLQDMNEAIQGHIGDGIRQIES